MLQLQAELKLEEVERLRAAVTGVAPSETPRPPMPAMAAEEDSQSEDAGLVAVGAAPRPLRRKGGMRELGTAW